MNERMIELYQEASEFAYKICREEGREGGTSDHIWNTLSTGRFAELIVRECLTVANKEHKLALEFDWDNDDTATSIKDSIKQHFGIEGN